MSTESRSPVTCHVLDSSIGKPAAGVAVELQEMTTSDGGPARFETLAKGVTNADGRCMQLWPDGDNPRARAQLVAGKMYKVVFQTQEYFAKTDRTCFYPWVDITFQVPEGHKPDEHYHIPLLLSPCSYTTYRGS